MWIYVADLHRRKRRNTASPYPNPPRKSVTPFGCDFGSDFQLFHSSCHFWPHLWNMKSDRIGLKLHDWINQLLPSLIWVRYGGGKLWSSYIIMIICYSSTIHPWSLNSHIWGFPQIGLPPKHPFKWEFHYKPSIFGYPHLWNPPYEVSRMMLRHKTGAASCSAVLCAAWASFTSAAWAVCQRSLHLIIGIQTSWVYKSLFSPNRFMNIDDIDSIPHFFVIQLLTHFYCERHFRGKEWTGIKYIQHHTIWSRERLCCFQIHLLDSSWLSECKHSSSFINIAKRVRLGSDLSWVLADVPQRLSNDRETDVPRPWVVPVLARAFRASHRSAPADLGIQ